MSRGGQLAAELLGDVFVGGFDERLVERRCAIRSRGVGARRDGDRVDRRRCSSGPRRPTPAGLAESSRCRRAALRSSGSAAGRGSSASSRLRRFRSLGTSPSASAAGGLRQRVPAIELPGQAGTNAAMPETDQRRRRRPMQPEPLTPAEHRAGRAAGQSSGQAAARKQAARQQDRQQ